MRSPTLPLALVILLATGCAQTRGPRRAPAAPTPADAPARTAVLRDGARGIEVGRVFLDALLERNDVIAFGEYHDDPEGSAFEQRLWERLTAKGARPTTLAMEFFERDTQQHLDAYLAGSLAEEEFVKRTRQGPGYPKAHRPLIERAKAEGRPVVAANAPRRLVTAYRKQEAPYAEWLATLPEADRAALPRTTRVIEDAYRDRFMALMGPERGPKIFRAQSLWDDAMAEAVADRRAAHPEERVLLIVGGFHVQGRLGTLKKLAERRPNDRVGVIVMAYGEGPGLALPADMRGEADFVLCVPKPPEPAPPRKMPAVPSPNAPTAPKPPATQPPGGTSPGSTSPSS